MGVPTPGGWYASALASGEWVHTVNGLDGAGRPFADYILTHAGRLDYLLDSQLIDETLPAPQIPRACAPLFVRMGRDPITGHVRFAGPCWGRDVTYVEYNFTTKLWRIFKVNASSNFPVLYDLDGKLRINRTPDVGDLGANGIRFAEHDGVTPGGRLISGDATYSPTAAAPKMSEWTRLPCGLIVGQGHEVDGVIVYDGKDHRWLATGACKGVNVDEGLASIAISFYRERKDLSLYATEADRVLTTEAALRALPILDPMPVALEPTVPAAVPFSGFWVVNEEAPGNIAIGGLVDAVPHHACVLATWDKITRVPEAQRLGVLSYLPEWLSESGIITALARDRALSEEYGIPTFVYFDGRVFPFALFKKHLGAAPWVAMPQWYLRANKTLLDAHETPAAFARDVIEQAKAFGGHPFLPVIRMTLGGWLIPAADVVEALNELIRQEALTIPGCLGRIGWAWNRKDGASPHAGDNNDGDPLPLLPHRYAIDLWMQTPTTVTNPHEWIAQYFPETPMPEPIPSNVQATMLAISSVYLLPQNDPEAVKVFSRRVAEQVAFEHNTPEEEWGLKSSAPNNPISNNITRRRGSHIDTWDWIVGSAGSAPRLNISDAEHFYVPNQTFHPVTATDHMATAKPTPGRALLPGRVWGVDAFDLAPRTIGLRDFRWLEQVLAPTQLVSRQFMNVDPAPPGRLTRSPALGLQQVSELLIHMRARKTKGSIFTVLCGTRNLGMSWQDALDYCRACNALYEQFPELVVGVDLFNENRQSFEQDYAVNAQFLREAEACFNLKFPVSPGAAWGDEPPLRSAGSYLVGHGERNKRPAEAALQMLVPGWRTLDREGMGITEVGRTAGRQRVAEVAWALEQIAAVKRHPELAGSILHIDAGMSCDVGEMPMGGIQRACIALYAAEVGAVVIPPPAGHPVLDANMTVDSVWYPIFVKRHDELRAAIIEEYKRITGIVPHDEMIRHYLYRACAERKEWRTLRRALEDTGTPG